MALSGARTYKLDICQSSASYDYRAVFKTDEGIFNVALVPDATRPNLKVPVVAVDLARNSEWFQLFLNNRRLLGATNTDLLSVEVPGNPSYNNLEDVVASLYSGSIELSPDKLEGILRTANAMQMPAIESACKSFIRDSLTPWETGWAVTLYDITSNLLMIDMVETVAQHMVSAALREEPKPADLLPLLYKTLAEIDSVAAQMRLLRAGIELCVEGPCWSQALLVTLLMQLDQFVEPPASRPCKRPRTGLAATPSSPQLDVAALLQLVDWQSLHPLEMSVLSQQAASFEKTTPAALARKDALLRQTAHLLRQPRDVSNETDVGEYMVCVLNLDQLRSDAAAGTGAELHGRTKFVGKKGAKPMAIRVGVLVKPGQWYVLIVSQVYGSAGAADVSYKSCTIVTYGSSLARGCRVHQHIFNEVNNKHGKGFSAPLVECVKAGLVSGQTTRELVIGAWLQVCD